MLAKKVRAYSILSIEESWLIANNNQPTTATKTPASMQPLFAFLVGESNCEGDTKAEQDR
jgi:hypothetical protein